MVCVPCSVAVCLITLSFCLAVLYIGDSRHFTLALFFLWYDCLPLLYKGYSLLALMFFHVGTAGTPFSVSPLSFYFQFLNVPFFRMVHGPFPLMCLVSTVRA